MKPNVTPLTEDKQLLERLFEEQPDITELYPEPSYDDLKMALHNYLNPDDVEEEVQSTESTVETAAAATANVADDFDQLFNT